MWCSLMPSTRFLPDLAFFFFFFFFSLMRRKSFCFGFSFSLSFTEPRGQEVSCMSPANAAGWSSISWTVLFWRHFQCIILTNIKAALVWVFVLQQTAIPVQLVLLAFLPQQCPLLVAVSVDCRRGWCAPASSLQFTTQSCGNSNSLWGKWKGNYEPKFLILKQCWKRIHSSLGLNSGNMWFNITAGCDSASQILLLKKPQVTQFI